MLSRVRYLGWLVLDEIVVKQVLTLRAKLLVAEYGLKRVIEALAETEDVGYDAIYQEIEDVKIKKSNPRRRKRTIPMILREANINADRYNRIEEIACDFENRRYLPDLMSVRSFLESHDMSTSTIRSRSAALPTIVRILGELPENELIEIEAKLDATRGGDLKIIADQILGNVKKV